MKKVIDFLKENVVATLATCSDNKPRASIVEYYMIDDAIIFGTDPDSLKAHNLNHNPRISMSVSAMPKFVTVDGVVVAPTKDEIESYTKLLFEFHPEFKELMEKGMMGNSFVHFKIAPEIAYYNDFTNGMAPTEVINDIS